MSELQLLFLVNTAVGFALSWCVLVVAYAKDRQLLLWAAAFAIHGISYVLLSFRGTIPNFFSVLVANALLASMLALFTEGIYRFEELRPPRLLIWWPIPVTVITFWIFSRNFDMRVIIGAVLSSYQTAFLVWRIATDFAEKEGRGKWIIITAAVITTAMFVCRAIFSLTGNSLILAISSNNPVQSITFVGSIVGLIMFAFGLLVMFKERAEHENFRLAMHDPLTQLSNRRVLEVELQEAMRKSAKTHEFGAVLLLDLDRFKTLNDTYGHSIGDQVLVEVAYRLKESVKAKDSVVRLGGDEFVLLLPSLGSEPRTARENAVIVANRVLTQLSQPYNLLSMYGESETPAVTYKGSCSIGGVFFDSAKLSPAELLELADKAMYQSKQEGRNRVTFQAMEQEGL